MHLYRQETLCVLLLTYVLWVKGQNDGCLAEESDVTTGTRHVCLGARGLVRNPSSEENDGDDGYTLQERVRRLRVRTLIMYRSLKSLKIHYQYPASDINGGVDTSTNRTCLQPLNIRGNQLLSIQDQTQLLRRLEQDFVSLTTVAGVLSLMRQDDSHLPEMTKATVSVQSAICEMFLTISKIKRSFVLSGQSMESQVSGNGFYNPVIPWCTVRNLVCREERNGIIMAQIVQFASVLKYNILGIRM